jgi:D-alanyl-D-alanine carboxypeptidase/D-alanyl-D-alanine-endopeptidase (penicillin-binding protein 4)
MHELRYISITCFFLAFLSYAGSESYKEILLPIIKKDPNLNIGIIIKSSKKSEFFYSKHPDRLFTPGSCIKLFTAAAALHILGPEFCFRTAVYTSGTISNNELLGNLYIKASGDPSLTMQDIEELIKKVQEKGLKKITGNVYLDTSIFEDNFESYYGNGFCLDDLGTFDMPPVTSFIIDHNMQRLDNGKKTVILNPHEYVSALVEKFLTDYAISYTKPVMQMSVPDKAQELAWHVSEPLHALLAYMLKKSDNLFANAMFKYLGAYKSGLPGTWQNSKEVMQDFLKRELGIQPSSYVIEDGAGLSRYNLVSPSQIIQLLTWFYNNKKIFSIFRPCLALSGKDGTLKHRLIEYPGIVAAKTGTMSGVSSLSGYICLEDHEPIIFSIMLNGFIQKKLLVANHNDDYVSFKHDIEDALCEEIIKIVSIPIVSADI